MLLFIAIFVFSLIALLYVINYSVHGSRKGRLINKIPGPYPWPIVGNIAELTSPLENLWDLAHKLNREYYPIYRMWTVNVPIVNIHHPDDVEAFLTSMKHTEKSIVYEFFHPWLGTGLLTSKGAKWHDRRKILTPAFHFKVLQQFVSVFVEESDKLAKSVCAEGEEVVPDLLALLHKYTLNTICETAMGFKSDLMDDKVMEEYRSCVTEMNNIFVNRVTRPWLYLDWMFKFFKKFKDQVRVLKVLHGFSTNIITERKRYHAKTNGQHLLGIDSDNSFGPHDLSGEHVADKRRLAMLDLLISAQKQGANIDDVGIREEVDTFVFEGHDTTAAALCFALLLLAEHKEIQEKARTEVDAIFEGKERAQLSLREIKSLSYVERCMKETLRLFPSVPLISRHVSTDIQLKNYLIPSGTVANVFIWDLHKDPNFWPNPDVYDPDRFLPDQIQGRHPFSYVPFSAGPRNCIGQKFAMLELQALVGTFLRNFYLEPIDLSSEVQVIPDLVLRPIKPIRIKLIRRPHNN